MIDKYVWSLLYCATFSEHNEVSEKEKIKKKFVII